MSATYDQTSGIFLKGRLSAV